MCTKHDPIISVIIPTFQIYEMLCQAIQSVKAQTYKNIEVIVVDDCSNDNTSNIVNLFPSVIYFRNEKNSGPGFSRQFGLRNSHGEFVVFLDDDDFYTDNNYFYHALTLLKSNPEYSFVSANATILYTASGETEQNSLNVSGKMSAANYLEGFPFKNKKPPSTFTTIFRKSILQMADIDTMQMVNDIPLYMRCLTVGGFVFFLEREVGVYRIHNTNISKAISADFIIENLKEKANVLEYIKEKKIFTGYNTWWSWQINGTISYYVTGSQPSLSEYRKVRQWIIQYSEEKRVVREVLRKYTKLLLYYKQCAVKTQIKDFFKKKHRLFQQGDTYG